MTSVHWGQFDLITKSLVSWLGIVMDSVVTNYFEWSQVDALDSEAFLDFQQSAWQKSNWHKKHLSVLIN